VGARQSGAQFYSFCVNTRNDISQTEGSGVHSRMVLGGTDCSSAIGSKLRRIPLPVFFISLVLVYDTNQCIEYPFAKYNTQTAIYAYSQDEYAQFLEGTYILSFPEFSFAERDICEDEEWSKEETDYLFKTVQEYDSRWYIIFDRYEYPGGVSRTVEVCLLILPTKRFYQRLIQDLKDRYYGVCRKLVRNRPWEGDEANKAQLLSNLEFHKGSHI